MRNIMTLLAVYAVAFAAVSPALAQSGQSFQMQKGQAIRITPDGKVDVFTTMQGDTAHIAKMEKRAKPVTKGLAVWVGADGKLRYLTNPVEGAEHFGHQK
jgi:hypothetical protein